MPADDVFYHHLLPDPGGSVLLDGREGKHARSVRRINVGEELTLTDGSGGAAHCTVQAVEQASLHLLCVSRRAIPQPNPRIIVVQALVKGDKADDIFDVLTQVGADRIIPWQAERCIRKVEEKISALHSRWLTIAMNAAKQSRRMWFPEIERPMSTSLLTLELPEMLGPNTQYIILDENATEPLGAVLAPGMENVCVFIGPEGGISEKEISALSALGARPAMMGPTVLRSWLAGAAAVSAISAMTDRWSQRPLHS